MEMERCPLCGGSAELGRNEHGLPRVSCMCGLALDPPTLDPQEAVCLWNTRQIFHNNHVVVAPMLHHEGRWLRYEADAWSYPTRELALAGMHRYRQER